MRRRNAALPRLLLILGLSWLMGCATTREEVPPKKTDAVSGASRKAPAHENRPGHEEACRDSKESAEQECQWDSQCGVCHDGSPCGTAMTKDELTRRGADCRNPDSADCEYSAPRCCKGRCVQAPS